MRVAVEKLPGVTEALVSLEEGHVVVHLDTPNDLTIAGLRNAIRDQGFTPRGAMVRVAGRLEAVESALRLSMPGSAPPYPLVASGELLERLAAGIGERVVLSGRLLRDEEAEGPVAIHVTDVEGS